MRKIHFLHALCFSVFLLSASLPAAAADGKALDVKVIKSKSGIEAWLVQDKTVPVISVSFSFDGGLGYDPDDKPGTGRLVSILLDEGAGDLKSQDFQRELSNNAIGMSFTAGRDAFYGGLKTLSSNKDKAFGLLKMALTSPRFDADAIERMRNANISQIKQDSGNPGWLAARIFNGTVFEGHFYERPGFGNLDSMQRINRQDLVTFVKSQFARDVLKVAIAGDISEEEATAALDTIFAGLPEKAEEAPSDDVTLANVGKTILLPLDTAQTSISVAEQGLSRIDPDWDAAVIMNYILGGSDFDARLMREIREKRGLTYGVYSTLSSMKHAALIQANMQSSNEKAQEALAVLRQEWTTMAKDGPTDQELKDAKSYLTGSLLLNLTSTSDVSDVLNDIQRDGLPPEYINKRNTAINAVTLKDVQRVSQRLLKPENLTVVLVGKPEGINVDILLDKPPGMKEPTQKK